MWLKKGVVRSQERGAYQKEYDMNRNNGKAMVESSTQVDCDASTFKKITQIQGKCCDFGK